MAILLSFVPIALAYAGTQDAAPVAAPASDLPKADDAPGLPDVPVAARLTLEQALAVGLSANPSILAAQGQVESAQGTVTNQSAPIPGSFNYSGVNNTVAPSNFFSNPQLGSGSNYVFYIPIETSGRFLLRGAQARAQLQSAKSSRETTRLTVRQSVINGYINLQVANEVLDSERVAYASAKRLVYLTSTQVQVGTGKEVDAIRARVALVQEGQNMQQDVASVLNARANLNLAIGRNASSAIDATEPLAEPASSASDSANAAGDDPIAHVAAAAGDSNTLTSLQTQAIDNRPEIRASQADERALHAATKIQRSAYIPDVVLARDLSGHGIVSAGITVPFPDWGANRGAVRAAEANEKVQRDTTLQAVQQARLDVQTAYIALEQARDNVDAYRSGILPQSASLLQRIQQGYQLHANTILDLLDAESAFRQTHDGYYAALGNYYQAIAQLERAIGGPIPGNLLSDLGVSHPLPWMANSAQK